jgi:hypothetical protein
MEWIVNNKFVRNIFWQRGIGSAGHEARRHGGGQREEDRHRGEGGRICIEGGREPFSLIVIENAIHNMWFWLLAGQIWYLYNNRIFPCDSKYSWIRLESTYLHLVCPKQMVQIYR